MEKVFLAKERVVEPAKKLLVVAHVMATRGLVIPTFVNLINTKMLGIMRMMFFNFLYL